MKKKRRQRNTINFSLAVGIALVSAVLLFVFVGLFYTPYDPMEMSMTLKNKAPSLSHPFGTDYLGRDILSRVMDGAGTTFLIGAATVLIGLVAGTLIGAFTGYYGGLADEILMRLNDTLTSFPSILLALVFVSVIGTGKYNIIIALGIIFIPSFARVVRGEFIVQKELDYVRNAKLLGAGNLRIMFVHILPNTAPILISAVTIGLNNAILAESGMSYLSLGVQPPDPSLGRMLSEAQGYLMSAPWAAVAPGMMIVLTVLGFSMISENIGRGEMRGK
ncbi:MAG: ABC transporter permease [Lachnospiraceae bacterium]|jgi:peptide/nickel transport system permease protein|nr:ABC transporter permease [Lachnospiraceae bacterium]MCX4346912.1 ABC transporter permease [Lachnospiraceae bacterium]